MEEERKIEILITNEDLANHVGLIDQSDLLIYNALKKALLEHNIHVENLRLGTLNINTGDAQLGRLDKPFEKEDYQRLFNQFLKGISFQERRIATLFAKPLRFEYNIGSVVQDVHYHKPASTESISQSEEHPLQRYVKSSIPTSLLIVNEVMEYLTVSGI